MFQPGKSPASPTVITTHIYTCAGRRPLVAAVVTTAAEEEVRSVREEVDDGRSACWRRLFMSRVKPEVLESMRAHSLTWDGLNHNSLHICNRHTHTDTYMFEHFTGISAKKLCAAGNLHNHDEHCKHKGRELNHREMHQWVSSLCRRLCRHISLKLSISEHLQQKTPSSAKRSFLSNHLS